MLDIFHTEGLLAIAGFIIGLLLSITMIQTRFCTMGAVADIAISGNYQRMRSWLLAMVTAIVGLQLAVGFELIDIEATNYLQPKVYWLAAIIGGLLFGFGMVIACGCGARSIVMAGCGDLRALVAVTVLGITAYMTMRGILAIPRSWFYLIGVTDSTQWLTIPSVNGILDTFIELPAFFIRTIATGLVIAPMLYFIFRDAHFRASNERITSGLAVGLLVILSWLTTGWLLVDEFDEKPPSSLTFVAPVGDTLQYLMIWTGLSITFAIAVVLGMLVGSLGWSNYRKEFQLRGFEDASEMGRYMGGGALMGVGGALAGGCTFGQGISGVSTLSVLSIIALLSIIGGGILGVRYLEYGSMVELVRSFKRSDQ